MVRALGSLARGNLGLVRITTALRAEKSATLGANSGIGAPSSGGLTGRLQTQAARCGFQAQQMSTPGWPHDGVNDVTGQMSTPGWPHDGVPEFCRRRVFTPGAAVTYSNEFA